NLRISQISILEDEEFLKNTPSRCYLCKRRSMRDLKAMAAAEGIESVADGLNLSDYGDYRPGILACDEEGIWHPFVEAGMTKEEIREVCRLLGLPFWNSPSSACLATRIPYGQRIEPVDLIRVEEAESYLGSLGFQQVRVRSHGDLARVELLRGDAERALALRDEISERLRDIGYCYVALDLDGFRSGRMNEALWRSHP
ncbi:MAG: ATP-dependent sacrificial sulfur transferase LarE, partial [Methanothrix sp.]|nr:ATP-dependent sacrificial sulfur transferase LarE [Methanothrix sp.]